MRYIRLMIVAGMFVAGCHLRKQPTKPINYKVKVVSSQAVTKCEFLTMLVSQMGGNWQSFEENVVNAQNDLRAKADRIGATHLVIISAGASNKAGNWTDQMSGSHKCNNCVQMSGQAFMCRRPKPKAPPPSKHPKPPVEEIQKVGEE